MCVDLSFLVKTTDCEQLPSLNVYIYSVTVYSLDLHIVTPPVLELWTVIRTEQVLRSIQVHCIVRSRVPGNVQYVFHCNVLTRNPMGKTHAKCAKYALS